MHCTKISTEFEFGVIAPWVCIPRKCGIGLRHCKNQCRLSSLHIFNDSSHHHFVITCTYNSEACTRHSREGLVAPPSECRQSMKVQQRKNSSIWIQITWKSTWVIIVWHQVVLPKISRKFHHNFLSNIACRWRSCAIDMASDLRFTDVGSNPSLAPLRSGLG